MYFALMDVCSGNGYGSAQIRNLIQTHKNIVLSIEKPYDEQSTKRRYFYIKNGLYSTGAFLHDSGVSYEMLSSMKGVKPTTKIIKCRYLNMSDDSEINGIIMNTFDIYANVFYD